MAVVLLVPPGRLPAVGEAGVVQNPPCETQISAGESGQQSKGKRVNESKRQRVKAADVDFNSLLRFEVPAESVATDASPVRIEAEIVRVHDRGPLTLRGYVLVPVREPNDGTDKGEDKKTTTDKAKPREYWKIPFGMMDVVAPLKAANTIVLYPYEDAQGVRMLVKPGDVLWVGVEAFPAAANNDPEAKKLDIDIKVRRLLSW
jgi:hypothetical protein